MPTIQANGITQYYEIEGEGPPLVFVHGAFVDLNLWDPQVAALRERYRVVRYDLRGHGRTGAGSQATYTIELFADDLHALLDALGLDRVVVIGLSLGGMVAQSFAVKYGDRLRGLVLCDTAVSTRLTLSDRLQRYVLFPRWLMHLTIRAVSAEGFTRFSFWLARQTRSEAWLGRNERTRAYVRECMLAVPQEEYLKIYDAIYDFDLLDLGAINAPVLVINGEHESGSVFRHTEEILRRVPEAQARVIPDAGHTSNLENPAAFNALMMDFLDALPD